MVERTFHCVCIVVEELENKVEECKMESRVMVRTVKESAVAVHTYSVSKRVGIASIFGLKESEQWMI
jgi:hypothetical protein